jgi:hypothetical protein
MPQRRMKSPFCKTTWTVRVNGVLLKAPENLKAHQYRKKHERARLQAALESNQPLAMAYYMKERVRLLFQCADRDRANAELTTWIHEPNSSGIRILKRSCRQVIALEAIHSQRACMSFFCHLYNFSHNQSISNS